MKNALLLSLLLLCIPALANAGSPTVEAASKFVKEVKWRQESVVAGDFSCRGKQENAILGITSEHIVVAIFYRGLTKPPEVLRYSITARNPATAVLTLEDMDFNPKEFEREVGYLPPGMRPSKSCKGLNISNGEIDSAHIYWNHDAQHFADWVL